VPRLVYSPNLDDETSDLKILARMTNLNAQSMPQFTAGNFAVPEPATLLLFGLAGLAAIRRRS
jgi:PEP-CTERM motif